MAPLTATTLWAQRNLGHPQSSTNLHLGLDPGSDDVGLVGELSAQPLVVLLASVLLDQGLVSLRNQLSDLRRGRRSQQHTKKVSSLGIITSEMLRLKCNVSSMFIVNPHINGRVQCEVSRKSLQSWSKSEVNNVKFTIIWLL